MMHRILNNPVIFLPGSYSLARLVENRFYTNLSDLAKDYATVIAKSSKALRKKGYTCIFFLEPYVGFDLSNDSSSLPNWFGDSISIPDIQNMTVGMHFPKAEAELIVPKVENSTLNFVGIDLIYSSGLKINTLKDVFLGIMDGSRFGIESLEEIRNTVKYFLETAQFSGSYYIGPNDRLYDIPFDLAVKKIDVLPLKSVF